MINMVIIINGSMVWRLELRTGREEPEVLRAGSATASASVTVGTALGLGLGLSHLAPKGPRDV
jgi:hypothetical protein